MKENEFLDAISNIEPDVVERFVDMDNKLHKKAVKAKSTRAFLRILPIAACFILVICIALILPLMLRDEQQTLPPSIDLESDRLSDEGSAAETTDTDTSSQSNNGNNELPDVPIWEDAQLTAKEVGEIFGGMKYDGATNAYTKVYVPSPEYLYIDDLPEDEYLGIYNYNKKTQELDRDEFQNLLEEVLPRLEGSLDADLPDYEIKQTRYNSLTISANTKLYYINADQNDSYYQFYISSRNDNDGRRIYLDGEAIEIDQRLSDDEIIASIEPIKNKLFEIFNVNFPDVSIVRRFNSYSEYGASWIEIYFYDKKSNPLDLLQGGPKFDYIPISFDNAENYEGDIISDSILTDTSISYIKKRVNTCDEYILTAKSEMISIEEAEELLYNGYVFAGHVCPICMANQDKVSFEGYDFVDIEYIFGYDYSDDTYTKALPFYAFYKNIGTAENGNTVYAKTYVSALKVSGYKEYFKEQEENHRYPYTETQATTGANEE